MSDVRAGQRAIYDGSDGKPNYQATGFRSAYGDGSLRAEMQCRDGRRGWMFCRAHEGCLGCAEKRAHWCPESNEGQEG